MEKEKEKEQEASKKKNNVAWIQDKAQEYYFVQRFN